MQRRRKSITFVTGKLSQQQVYTFYTTTGIWYFKFAMAQDVVGKPTRLITNLWNNVSVIAIGISRFASGDGDFLRQSVTETFYWEGM